MDGGGRLLRSVNAALGAGIAPEPAFAGGGLPARTGRMLPLAPRTASARPRMPLRASERARRRLPRFLGITLLAGFFGSVALFGVYKGGQYEDFVAFYGQPADIVARALGFGIDEVTISGISELDQTEVLQIAGVDPRGSTPFFDAATARDRLLATPIVKDASVRKLFPNALSISLVERQAFALWQSHGDLYVVSDDGTVIQRYDDERYASLPLVVGEGAAAKAPDFTRLLASAPSLRAHIRAGILHGQRRWDLKLDNGMDVRLPEEAPDKALMRLAALEKEQKVLGRDVLSIDLRQPDRVVLRLSEEAAAARADDVKARSKSKGSPI
jgi:cell division protein FtsQ